MAHCRASMPSQALADWAAMWGDARGFLRIAEARAYCAARGQGARLGAADLSKGHGGSQPKLYMVASPLEFADAYVRSAKKPAYEVIEANAGCFLSLIWTSSSSHLGRLGLRMLPQPPPFLPHCCSCPVSQARSLLVSPRGRELRFCVPLGAESRSGAC